MFILREEGLFREKYEQTFANELVMHNARKQQTIYPNLNTIKKINTKAKKQ